MRKERGWLSWLQRLDGQVQHLRRQTMTGNAVRQCKIVDCDPDGSRQPGQVQCDADGQPRVRMCWEMQPDSYGGMPIISSWLPWFTGSNGNVRDWCSPTCGEQGIMLSFSNELGIHNSVFIPTFWTTEDGEKIQSKSFVPAEDGKHPLRVRRSIERKEDKLTLNAKNQQSNAEENTTQAKYDPKDEDAKYSIAQDSYQCDYCTVAGADNSTQTENHEATWPTATTTRFNRFADNTGEMKDISEDIEQKKFAGKYQDPTQMVHLVQDAMTSSKKTKTAGMVQTVNWDRTSDEGDTGNKKKGNSLWGYLDRLWKTGTGGGSGQNKATKQQTPLRNWLNIISPAKLYDREARANFYERLTRFGSATDETKVTQEGASYKNAQSGGSPLNEITQAGVGMIRRVTGGGYMNNALKNISQMAGQTNKNDGGQVAKLLGGNSVKIGANGPVKIMGLPVKISLGPGYSAFGGGQGGGGGGQGGGGGVSVTEDGIEVEAYGYKWFRFTPTKLRDTPTPADAVQIAELIIGYDETANAADGTHDEDRDYAERVNYDDAEATNPGGNNPVNEGPEKAIDNLVATKWLDYNEGTLVIEFPEVVNPDWFTFTTANDHAERDPVRWKFEASADGNTWDLLHEQVTDYATTTARQIQQEWFPLTLPKMAISQPTPGTFRTTVGGMQVDQGPTGMIVSFPAVSPPEVLSVTADGVVITGAQIGGVDSRLDALEQADVGLDGRIDAIEASYWKVLAASAVAISHSTTGAETTLLTVQVPANAMGPNGVLRITSLWSMSNNDDDKIIKAKFGGTIHSQYQQSNTSTLRSQTQIANRNSLSSQVGFRGDDSSVGQWGDSQNSVITSAHNTGLNQNITLTAQANAGNNITLQSYVVELLYRA